MAGRWAFWPVCPGVQCTGRTGWEQAWASFGNGRFQGITEGVGVGTDALGICLLLPSF